MRDTLREAAEIAGLIAASAGIVALCLIGIVLMAAALGGAIGAFVGALLWVVHALAGPFEFVADTPIAWGILGLLALWSVTGCIVRCVRARRDEGGSDA